MCRTYAVAVCVTLNRGKWTERRPGQNHVTSLTAHHSTAFQRALAA
jgi:hypothetical protein